MQMGVSGVVNGFATDVYDGGLVWARSCADASEKSRVVWATWGTVGAPGALLRSGLLGGLLSD